MNCKNFDRFDIPEDIVTAWHNGGYLQRLRTPSADFSTSDVYNGGYVQRLQMLYYGKLHHGDSLKDFQRPDGKM
jgi:hypothetical protein